MNELTLMPGSGTQQLLVWAERVIQQSHYELLNTMTPLPLEGAAAEIQPGDVICLFRVSELVFRREEGCLPQLTTVLNALHACGASCLMLLQCREGRCELYLGAVNKQKYSNPFYLNTIREILRSGLEGNLPGTELTELISRRDIERKLEECLDSGFDSQCITAVSCVAGEAEAGRVLPGIENLVDAMGSRDLSILVLADPVGREELQQVRQGYEDLSSQLSALEASSVSVQTSDSDAVSLNYSESFSRSLSHSLAETQSHTTNSGWNRSSGETGSKAKGRDKAAKGAAVAAGVGAALLGGELTAGYFAMNALNALLTPPGQSNRNEGESGGESDSTGFQESNGETLQEGVQQGKGETHTKTQGLTVQATLRNRHAAELTGRVERYLQWLNRCENYGMFNCCAYIISASAGINLMAASEYQALMQGKTEVQQPVSINTWTRDNGVEAVRRSLLHLTHPAMDCRELGERFTPAMLLSSRELARQMALPQRSVVGVSVMEYAAFGREVVRKTPLPFGRTARLGVVSHMGKALPRQPVLLDLQSMASHTFVAGTNGSGKSNAIFRLLEELLDAGIPFMVIEPAKGEYKNVFGRADGVKIYGTNRRKTPLLRLNPFWFNKDVNIKEHISRLMDVFGASWSMYDAMTSILNASIENAYRACGWNLSTSRCGGPRIFPTVRDVLEAIKEKMASSAYSAETQGNYVGALTSRMESLCDGIYTDIFSGADLGDEALFNESVIVDLSRAGSPETSAMIMGMLLIRLREYRMSEGALNHPLRHVTVLEEAHNLLRRTSPVQSSEGANLMGKSVEMIANAIAEMRSYGDGFIIADQSPGLLDESVLRNTNTKVILRLPEGRDRELIAATMGLNEAQAFELSRLKTGVCAIYQKDWLEPVLCQIDRAVHQEVLYRDSGCRDQEDQNRDALAAALLAPFVRPGAPAADPRPLAMTVAMPGAARKRLLRSLVGGPEGRLSWKDCAAFLTELIPLAMELPFALDEASMRQWFHDTAEANELDGWEEADLRGLFSANLTERAAKDARWKDLLPRFPAPENGSLLGEIRGRALQAVCLGEGSAPIPQEELEGWRRELKNASRPEDRMLGELLTQFAADGRQPRKRGELTPYAGLAWCYAGGKAAWEEGYPLLQAGDMAGWDRLVRSHLAQEVRCGRELATELASLTLQHRGADSVVKGIYFRWLAYAKSGNSKANSEPDTRGNGF